MVLDVWPFQISAVSFFILFLCEAHVDFTCLAGILPVFGFAVLLRFK